MSTAVRTSSENGTSRFWNRFLIIQSHYAGKCVSTILELNNVISMLFCISRSHTTVGERMAGLKATNRGQHAPF